MSPRQLALPEESDASTKGAIEDQVGPDRNAAMDKVFAQLGNDNDSLADFGDI